MMELKLYGHKDLKRFYVDKSIDNLIKKIDSRNNKVADEKHLLIINY